MKLTKQIKTELARAYRCALDVSLLDLKAPLRYINLYIAQDVSGYGTAIDEKVQSRAEFKKMVMTARQQAKGMSFKARIITPYQPKFIDDTTAQFRQEIEVTIGTGKNRHSLYLWFSTLFKYRNGQWQMVLFHGSMPETGSSSADTFHLTEAAQKLKELEQVVEERTADLQSKNRELEIETALEKVRAVAMGMKKREDMLKICTMIAKQLAVLGLKEIRNVQTAIFNVPKGTYMNYEFYAKHDKTFITETLYTNHKVALAFAKKMLKGKGEVSITHIKGKEKVLDWLRYQKGTNVFIDSYLKKAISLSYYWYSLGPVALGISSYQPLTKDELHLFERFLKVFELAYQRYLDIEQAEAQVREAQIEAALERVRTRSMAMKDSTEIGKLILHVYTELTRLDARLDRCFFMIVDPENLGISWWMASQEGLLAENGFFVQYNEHPSHLLYLDHWKKRTKKWHYFFAGKEKRDWDRFGFSKTALSRLPEPVKKFMSAAKSVHLSGSSDAFGSLVTGSFEPLSEEHQEIISRFATVFNQTYTRFLDLQKAEAQTREAQIEAALERVRSRTMGMQKSEELKEVIQIVYDQLVLLKLPLEHTGFILDYQHRNDFDSWIADHLGSPSNIAIPYFSTIYYDRFNSAKNAGEQFFAVNLTKKEKDQFYRKLFKHLPGFPEASKAFIFKQAALTISTVLLDDIALYIENFSGIPYTEQENDILMRFAKVFQQTYTRFIDLQKAEEQAREAEIQLALERVRARTMAMQKSEELLEAGELLCNEMKRLGIQSLTSGYVLFDGEKRIGWNYTPNPGTGKIMAVPVGINHTETAVLKNVMDAWQNEEPFSIIELDEKETVRHQTFIAERSINFPISAKELLAISPARLVLHNFNFKEGYILIVGGEKLNEEQIGIMQRFAKLFQQTYTRFLDLQKAEAQAKEAEIQLALERVRARTMAMQQSSELREAANVLFQQMQHLGLPAWSAGYGTWNKDERGQTKGVTLWMSSAGIVQEPFYAPVDEDPSFRLFYEASLRDEPFFVKEIGGEDLLTHYQYMCELPVVGTMLKQFMAEGGSLPVFQIYHLVYFSHGFLLFITYEPVPGAHDIFKRFGSVFEQTYTRFLDLQKAEAQAREAQIEAALEKVRSRSLAMHQSEELQQVVNVVFEKIMDLGVPINSASIIVLSEIGDEMEYWVGVPGQVYLSYLRIPYFDDTQIARDFIMARQKGQIFNKCYTGPEKNEQWSYLFKHSDLSKVSDERKQFLLGTEAYNVSVIFTKNTALQLLRYDAQLFTEKENEIFQRFANVFEQAYIRFLDLKKAEAQARESQIEAALERVRSRAMSMHSSGELNEVVRELRKQMGLLGQKDLETCVIHLHDESPEFIHSWAAIKPPEMEGEILETTAIVPKKGLLIIEESLKAYASQQQDYIIVNEGEKLRQWFAFLKEASPDGYHKLIESVQGRIEELRAFWSFADFTGGSLLTVTMQQPDVATRELLRRFANVFGLAYRRFADLKQAEQQARESQIEAALERVRSQAMAMRQSADLLDIVVTMRTEFTKLGHEAHYFWYMRWLPEKYEKAMTSGDGTRIGMIMSLPRHLHGDIPLLSDWEKGIEPSVVYAMDVEAAISYVDKMVALGDFELVDPQAPSHDDLRHINGLTFVMARTAHGEIGYSLPGEVHHPPADDINVLVRFAGVFDLAYQRFEDLKEAERRNRETQIELALERVRARTMAMQSSNELQETAAVLFEEFKKLGTEEIYQVTIGTYKEEEQLIDFRVTDWAGSGQQEQRTFQLDMNEPTLLQPAVEAWKEGKKSAVFDLTGDRLQGWLDYRNQISGITMRSQDTSGRRVITTAYFSKGHLSLSSPLPLAQDTIKTLERFAAVFDGTYTRFIDLEKAEAQARESQIEAALEKVRSRTLAMQKSDELAETAAVLFQQLIALGIAPNRLYIILIKENNAEMEAWVTDEDGSKVSIGFTGNYERNRSLLKMYEGWRDKRSSLIIDMQGAELQEYFHYLHDELKVPFKGGLEQKRRVQHVTYFSHGLIGMASPEEQPAETIQLMERFAAVFNLTFTRFNDLKFAEAHAAQAELDLIAIKEAKQKAEEALTELQSTQKQLIQAEKMASLGELTAGIAHEIQNPLNFVNNFSEVSKELLDEIRDELDKGNLDDAKEIMQDVIRNLEKIHHHGKRADSIVKGMLQHSRTGSGQMEPTDINALCDEYLRLSYHGLRAKDKSFNARFETHFDSSIGKINVLPQDLGRVILNLINNAFYAVAERKKRGEAGYEPTVKVITRKSDNAVGIIVEDNGTGIPQSVVDKIFQPFFTTKPTGQGTGLGLSLSYDIVKAHGGELNVETIEGEGTRFIISLPVTTLNI